MNTILIGEGINSSNKRVRALFEAEDIDGLLELAATQVDCGADYIDVNASMMMSGEKEALFKVAGEIINRQGVNVSIDSADPDLLISAAGLYGERCLLNSFACTDEVFERYLPEASASGAGIIVMLKNDRGVPSEAEARAILAEKAVSLMRKNGMPDEKIFIDPVFSPLATDISGLETALETMDLVARLYPDCRLTGGLSNVSYGLPMRRLVNRTFLAMAIPHGLAAVICDVTDRALIEALVASEALSGFDKGCRNLLKHYRGQGSRR
ncbi:MAG: dihydropteroate synthase [Candidatus Krumholzibacteria bacterium]|nr:dihydropteroate synthase [Candidatus Krumholzibacteria bacterium]